MSRKSETWSLLPGAEGWEIWRTDAGGEVERTLENGPFRLGEIEDLPSGELVLFFPVKAFHALPFKASSADDSLFEDLSTMHAERLGIRPDPLAGQLSDRFVVHAGEDETTILHVVLRSPSEGELPRRTPQDFDLSARAFPVAGNAIAAWQELGRWVFAFYAGGKLLYTQATSFSETAPSPLLLREIQLAMGQLSMQGMSLRVDALHIWSPAGDLGEAGSLTEAFGVKGSVSRRPAPELPEESSRLLPADVRAARTAKSKKKKRRLAVLGVASLYLALIGWVGFGLWQDIRERNRLLAEAAKVEGVSAEFQEHRAKWDELGAVVESSRGPLEIMLQLGNSIPQNSGLRLQTADVALGDVKVMGSAPQSAPVNSFSLALKRNPDLSFLDWETGSPNNTQKGWEFVFSGKELP